MIEADAECESVTEAKGQSKAKPVNVLEAMAKYSLKKEQEKKEMDKIIAKEVIQQDFSRQIGAASPPKPKHFHPRTDSAQQSQATGHGAGSPQKRKHVAQEVFSEALIGITEFVHKGAGFSGILKQRYSDFLVYEGNSVVSLH